MPLFAIITLLSVLSVCLQATVTIRLTLNITEYHDLKAFGAFEVRLDLV